MGIFYHCSNALTCFRLSSREGISRTSCRLSFFFWSSLQLKRRVLPRPTFCGVLKPDEVAAAAVSFANWTSPTPFIPTGWIAALLGGLHAQQSLKSRNYARDLDQVEAQ